MKTEAYIVSYAYGEYEDYYEKAIAVFTDREKAEIFAEKKNNQIARIRKHFSQFNDSQKGYLKDEHCNDSAFPYNRWYFAKELRKNVIINKAKML